MLSLKTVKPGNVSSYFEKDDYYTKDDLGVSAEFHGRLAEKFGLKDAPFDRPAFDNFVNGRFQDGKEILQRNRSRISKDEATELFSILNQPAFAEKRLGIVKKISGFMDQKDRDFLKSSAEKYFAADQREQKKILSAIAKRGIIHASTEDFTSVSKYITQSIPEKKLRKSLRDSVKRVFSTNIRAGVDATFSAPKNISIRALVEGDTRLVEAHREAVSYTLKHLERETIFTRIKGRSGRMAVRTGNMLAGVFHHGTSRQTGDSLPDPQLHSHCVIMNFTELNGRYMHFYSKELYSQSKFMGLIYQNKLAELVQKLGYKIELKDNDTFDIVAYGQKVTEHFSKRTKQTHENAAKLLFLADLKESLKDRGFAILSSASQVSDKVKVKGNAKELVRQGYSVTKWTAQATWVDDFSGRKRFDKTKQKYLARVSQKDNREAVMLNRSVKKTFDRESLVRQWKKDLRGFWFRNKVEKTESPNIFGNAIDVVSAEKHLSERRAVFKENDYHLEALTVNLGRDTWENIRSSADDNNNMISIPSDKKPLLTTHSQAKLERQILDQIKNHQASYSTLATEKQAKNSAMQLGLNKGQAQAVMATATSDKWVSTWEGVAGSGKTFSLKVIKDYADRMGIKVTGLAPDGLSAKVLGDKIGAKSSTIHRYINQPSHDKGGVLIVDESGKVSTKLMAELIKSARKNGNRLILTGDLRQFSSIEAGRPFKAIKELNTSVTHAELPEHRRQKGSIVLEFIKGASIEEVVDLTKMQKSIDLRIKGKDYSSKVTKVRGKVVHMANGLKIDLKKEHELQRTKVAVAAASTLDESDIAASFALLDSSVIERKTEDSRVYQTIKAYFKMSQEERKDTLVLTDLKSTRAKIYRGIREKLVENGEIGDENVMIKIAVPKDMTESRKKDARYFNEGEILQFNDKGMAGVFAEVVGRSEDGRVKIAFENSPDKVAEVFTKELPSFNVFHKAELEISVRESLQWTKNDGRKMNREPVTVSSIDKENARANLIDESGHLYTIDLNQRHHIDQNLVRTNYSAQGMEAKTVLYAGGESSNSTSYYTLISRAKERVHLAIPDKNKFLAEIIQRSAQVNALDYVKAIEQEKNQEKSRGWRNGTSTRRDHETGR